MTQPTPKRGRPPGSRNVTTKPAVPRRSIRVPDAEWAAFSAACEKRGETASAVIRAAMKKYCGRE